VDSDSGMLQCVAVCCTMLQCVAVCCQCCNVLQCVAVCCSVLQCVALCCSVQCVDSGFGQVMRKSLASALRFTPNQCVAMRCNVLQCVAVRCSASIEQRVHENAHSIPDCTLLRV